jgi:diaminohydroxyphosphoribosylaminopyrimidine deaminase/5-amino-6-(5-phosphoribosylamino)uracil reductase
VLIEGGATLAAHAVRERVVDRLLLFYGPKLIGADGRPMLGGLGVAALAEASQLREVRIATIEPDIVVRASLGGWRDV